MLLKSICFIKILCVVPFPLFFPPDCDKCNCQDQCYRFFFSWSACWGTIASYLFHLICSFLSFPSLSLSSLSHTHPSLVVDDAFADVTSCCYWFSSSLHFLSDSYTHAYTRMLTHIHIHTHIYCFFFVFISTGNHSATRFYRCISYSSFCGALPPPHPLLLSPPLLSFSVSSSFIIFPSDILL